MEGSKFRTAVAVAAFAVSSIENKKDDINPDSSSNPKKSSSEIVEVSPRPETSGGLPDGANRPTPTVVATKLNNMVSRKRVIGSTSPIEKTPNSVVDKQSDEKTNRKEPVKRLGKADLWEKTEMEEIKERFVKLKAKIFKWENKKKSKAKKKLIRKEGELEWKRARALQDYKKKMESVEKSYERAILKNRENRKNQEIRVKEKARMLRSTGKIPKTWLCC